MLHVKLKIQKQDTLIIIIKDLNLKYKHAGHVLTNRAILPVLCINCYSRKQRKSIETSIIIALLKLSKTIKD